MNKDEQSLPSVRLKPGREQSVKNRHPWVFSGALQTVPGGMRPGETVAVLSSEGRMLGAGAISPSSQITVRFWTFNPETPIDVDFFRDRLPGQGGTKELTGPHAGW